jgi:RNA polymerase sigma-70 factor (ECF subfamily)
MTATRSLASPSPAAWFDAPDVPAPGACHAPHTPEEQVSQYFHLLNHSIFRYLLTCCRDRDDAEELQQETFLRLYRALSRDESIANVRHWVFTVARNLMRDRAKHRLHLAPKIGEMPKDVDETLIDPTPTPEERLVTEARDAQWRAALDRLTLPERECVILRAQNLKLREIADLMQTKPRRVASLLERAIARLKKAADA